MSECVVQVLCGICYSRFEDTDSADQLPYRFCCNRIYHRKCLETWLHVNSKCPLCRIYVNFGSAVKMFLTYDYVDSNHFVLSGLRKAELEVEVLKKLVKDKDNIITQRDVKISKYNFKIDVLNKSLANAITKKKEAEEQLIGQRLMNRDLENKVAMLHSVDMLVTCQKAPDKVSDVQVLRTSVNIFKSKCEEYRRLYEQMQDKYFKLESELKTKDSKRKIDRSAQKNSPKQDDQPEDMDMDLTRQPKKISQHSSVSAVPHQDNEESPYLYYGTFLTDGLPCSPSGENACLFDCHCFDSKPRRATPQLKKYKMSGAETPAFDGLGGLSLRSKAPNPEPKKNVKFGSSKK